MDLLATLGNAGLMAVLSLIVGVLPLAAGVAYAIRPSEQRLALMRPISLAAIFGALCGTTAGFVNVLEMIWAGPTPIDPKILAVGSAEALVPLVVAFGCLTVAWLCAAFALRRHS
jgi:hypothetical protein